MNSAFSEAAQHAGDRLTCKEGCTQCCHGAFVLNQLDVMRLQAGMSALRESNAALAREVAHRAQMWIVEHESTFPGNAETGLLGSSDEERARFEDFANEAPCPGLDPESGCCDVYAWRPLTCRLFGPPVRMGEGLAHCELCFTDASQDEVAACEMEVPFDLEAELLEEIAARGETVVAYALAG